MMRTTLDLPDSLLRELKTRAAMNGQSLKTLLHELIVRSLRQPSSDNLSPAAKTAGPPMLQRLKAKKFSDDPANPATQPLTSNAELADLELRDDLEKLRRSGFIK